MAKWLVRLAPPLLLIGVISGVRDQAHAGTKVTVTISGTGIGSAAQKATSVNFTAAFSFDQSQSGSVTNGWSEFKCANETTVPVITYTLDVLNPVTGIGPNALPFTIWTENNLFVLQATVKNKSTVTIYLPTAVALPNNGVLPFWPNGGGTNYFQTSALNSSSTFTVNGVDLTTFSGTITSIVNCTQTSLWPLIQRPTQQEMCYYDVAPAQVYWAVNTAPIGPACHFQRFFRRRCH